MRPFFSFYGSKWRTATRYPDPLRGVPVVEPFAGGACYSLRRDVEDVVLVEKDPIIAAVWRWLIGASRSDVMNLPIGFGCDVRKLGLPDGAAALIGFWHGRALSGPRWRPPARRWVEMRPRSFWGAAARERIADQIEQIKGWRIIEGDYSSAPDIRATWFVDPPYQLAGKHYREGSRFIDYDALGGWCRSRAGVVVVCENDGASWLPFSAFMSAKSMKGKSREVVWVAA